MTLFYVRCVTLSRIKKMYVKYAWVGHNVWRRHTSCRSWSIISSYFAVHLKTGKIHEKFHHNKSKHEHLALLLKYDGEYGDSIFCSVTPWTLVDPENGDSTFHRNRSTYQTTRGCITQDCNRKRYYPSSHRQCTLPSHTFVSERI
jgi:hypothetical protein